jgi:hypothetical protein
VWVLLIERNGSIFFMPNIFFFVVLFKFKELFYFYETGPHPKIDVDYVLDLYTLYSYLLCWNIQPKVLDLVGIGSGLLIVVV